MRNRRMDHIDTKTLEETLKEAEETQISINRDMKNITLLAKDTAENFNKNMLNLSKSTASLLEQNLKKVSRAFENATREQIIQYSAALTELELTKDKIQRELEADRAAWEVKNLEALKNYEKSKDEIQKIKEEGKRELDKSEAEFTNKNTETLKAYNDFKNVNSLIQQEINQQTELYKMQAELKEEGRKSASTKYIDNISKSVLSKKEVDESLKKQRKQERDDRLATYFERLNAINNNSDLTDEQKELAKKEAREQEATDLTTKALENLKDSILDFSNTINNTIEKLADTFSNYQRTMNTRLQGSATDRLSMYSRIKYGIGTNPWVKLEDVLSNVQKATESGIAYNVEQRAFLETVKESVADTFDAFNSSLLQIIKVQQADTTASRLGMEASLTQLFNSYFSDTSYLSDVGTSSITSALSQAISQMSATESVAVEYQINKWLGALYSVGFSSSAVSSIAEALGKLGSGDISGLSSDEDMQNLLVMAMSKAGLSYSDFLINGLDSSNTNKLLKSMVEYLEEIAGSTNQVVKSEYASIFGMTVSDLTAVSNLSSSIDSLYKNSLDYNAGLNELYSQLSLSTQLNRIGTSGMLENLYDNFVFSTASTMASNPVTYITTKIANLLNEVASGINIPSITTFLGGVDLEASVADLMNVASLGMGMLGGIGSIISGVFSTFAPSTMLSKLGINQNSLSVIQRGSAKTSSVSGSETTSVSNYIGNSSGSDIQSSVVSQAQAEGQEQLEVKNAENEGKTTTDIYTLLYETFNDLMTGASSMNVNVVNTVEVSGSGYSYGYSSDAGI